MNIKSIKQDEQRFNDIINLVKDSNAWLIIITNETGLHMFLQKEGDETLLPILLSQQELLYKDIVKTVNKFKSW
jgi:hypothetical protein